MKTSYLLLQVFYVTNILNLASTSQKNKHANVAKVGVEIDELLITTNINNRYATTTVSETVMNKATTTKEFIFSILFPNNAFLTGFQIEKNGKSYASYIQGNEQARTQYPSVASNGSSSSYGFSSARDSQLFSVSFNLDAQSKTTFYLTYEELLQRKHGRYEQVTNINPGQLVKDLRVQINLNEVSEITDLEPGKLRSGNEIDKEHEELDPQAFISQHNCSRIFTSAKVLWMASGTEQKKFAQLLKTDGDNGFAGQFIIRYNVGGRQDFGEIITSNGYFVNFFSPKGLQLLSRHVVFLLDTSERKKKNKIEHLKTAMKNILKKLHENDLFSLVEFSNYVKVWNLDQPRKSVMYFEDENLIQVKFPNAYPATDDIIEKAIKSVDAFVSIHNSGKTDILSALEVGLQLVKLEKRNKKNGERQAIIMFLTDGKPTVGERSFKRINEKVTKLNSGKTNAIISTLSFGTGTDTKFLQSLALRNNGFYKHIYEANDSALQIEAFFDTISSPVLSNITYKYDSSSKVTCVSRTKFPVYYEGSELVVAGQYTGTEFKPPKIEALAAKGLLNNVVFPVHNSATDISHLTAFVTAKGLLNQKIGTTANNTEDDQSYLLDVCLKYSFVSPYSSLVIVKPNNEKFVLGTAELTSTPSNSSAYPLFTSQQQSN